MSMNSASPGWQKALEGWRTSCVVPPCARSGPYTEYVLRNYSQKMRIISPSEVDTTCHFPLEHGVFPEDRTLAELCYTLLNYLLKVSITS